jgi:4-hydroxybenzoate polyprenyltransferase
LTASYFRQPLATLAALVRWREWFDSKLPFFLVAMSYAVLRRDDPGTAQLAQMAALFVLLCLYAAFGHIVNDYSDRTADRKAGKNRILESWSEPAALTAILIPCVGAAGLAAACFDTRTLALTVLALLLAALYSLPPVQLKIRGILGWSAAALAQRTLPLAIMFQALGGWDAVAVALSVLGTLIGLRFIIVHQLRDRANDLRSGVHTLATEQDPRILMALLRGLFALEIACACAVVAAMAYFEPPMGAAALAYAAGLVIAIRRGRPVSPLHYFVFSGFYHVIWPITLAVLLAVRNPLFLPVVFVAVALVQRQARLNFRAIFFASSGAPPASSRPVSGTLAGRETATPASVHASVRPSVRTSVRRGPPA